MTHTFGITLIPMLIGIASGASLWVDKKRYCESDQHGRMFLGIRCGGSLEGTVKHDGYRDQIIDIGCSTDEVRFERSVELTRTAA